MRSSIWLSIAVFIVTIYSPQLLNYRGVVICLLMVVLLMCSHRWRYLSILPLTALYFSLFTYVILFGGNSDLIINDHITQNKSTSNQTNTFPENLISPILNAHDNTITVRVKSLINTKNSGYFIANIVSINNLPCILCPKVEMRWYRPSFAVQAGQRHTFKVKLKALQGKGNPNSFDRQKWRYSQHIAYIASIKEHISVVDERISFRAKLYLKMLELTEGMSQQGAILALAFADKSLLSTEDKEVIKALGIAHLFAISGLHIGLLFVFTFVIVQFLIKKCLPTHWLGWTSWRLAHLLSFSVCLGYAYISGFSLPTQRALLMLIFGVLMLASKRKISVFDLLVFSLWVILLIDPLAILSSSLWLSFTAMSAILLFIWAVQRRQERLNHQALWKNYLIKFYRFVKGLVLLQLLLTLFMLPIQFLNFSAISVFSLAVNLIAIPLFSWVIIPVTLLSTMLAMVSDQLALYLLMISNETLSVFMHYASAFSVGYILLSEETIRLLLTLLIFILLLLFSVYLYRCHRFDKKWVSILLSLFLAFVVIRIFEIKWQAKHSWQVDIFDVGQGLSILVSSQDQHLLYDAGPSYPGGYSVAEYTVLPYLYAKGINEIDYFFVSHSDNDHAGGRYVVDQHIKLKQAYSGEARVLNQTQQLNSGQAYQQCLTGQTFNLGALTLQVLSPEKPSSNNNDNSCVVKVSDGVNSILLTGDISRTMERKLVLENQSSKYQTSLNADILIAPHHGSKTSSSIEFIEEVDPEWVVFTAGYKNRWNFPIYDVVKRYKTRGIKDLTTGHSGFIRFNVENQHIQVKTYREDLAAYWYHLQIAF
ncbi:DNA internalization-related competence protein ComEC/Rec2 [Psychromonas aquatilis]|uniref:DNA internalization-related competence protein ComEC/Rec2 n=1 Tax=Psychromonas aquatilis TaxID=2005072 RepID=A0ABU9GN74_9GAMM